MRRPNDDNPVAVGLLVVLGVGAAVLLVWMQVAAWFSAAP